MATTSALPSSTGWRISIVRYDIKPAKDFLAHPLNFRIHPQAQQRATKGSLDTLGWIDEVMVNLRTSADWDPGERGVETMINGHLRVQLALREGEETPVPVKYVDLSPNDELTALGIFDELAAMVVKDKEKLGQVMQGAKPQDAAVAEMLSNMAQKEGLYQGNGHAIIEDDPPIDRAGALQEQWDTSIGQIWEITSRTTPAHVHRLLCGDSRDEDQREQLFRGVFPDVLLTDPPYGISVVKVAGATDGGSKPVTIGRVRSSKPYPFGGVRNMTATDGGRHLVDATLYRPVFGDDEPFDPEYLLSVAQEQILFGGNYFASRLPDSRCWIVWDKQNTGNFADAELAWTSFDKGVRLYSFLWNGLAREGSRAVEGVHRVHPTQKPVGLFAKIIEDFTEPGATIADLYLGSGTTLVAAELSGRTCYASEIDPAYVAVCLERCQSLGLEPRLVAS